MVRVLSLVSAYQKFEVGKSTQTRQASIFLQEGPAGESGADTPLQPLKGSFAISCEGEGPGDLMISRVRVPERFWARTGPRHTFHCRISIPHQSVSRPSKLMNERFVRQKLQGFIHQAARLSPIPRHHGRERSKVDCVLVSRALGPPDLNLLTRQLVFLTPNVNLHDAWDNRLFGLKGPSLVYRGFHNLNYLAYAYIQTGRFPDAIDTVAIVAAQYQLLAERETAPDTVELRSRHRDRAISAVPDRVVYGYSEMLSLAPITLSAQRRCAKARALPD